MDTEDLYRNAQIIDEPNEEVENEMKLFNWGAFGLGWIWGIGNKVYVKELITPCIIVFIIWLFKINNSVWNIPVIGIPLYLGIIFTPLFYFGKNGNKWAWSEKDWKDIQEFKKVQKKWAIITLITYCIIFLLASCLISSLFTPYRDKYTHSTEKLINIMMSDFNYKNVENGAIAAKYMVNYLNESADKGTKVSLYKDNTLKVSYLDKSKNEYVPFALYTITKEKYCSLSDKNCLVTTYMIKNEKTILVSKSYFDNNGDINVVKYVKNEK